MLDFLKMQATKSSTGAFKSERTKPDPEKNNIIRPLHSNSTAPVIQILRSSF
jgi:hypothetical protein